MKIPVGRQEWDKYLAATDSFWSGVLSGGPDASGTVVVEAFSQHIRVALRNLTVANAIRSITGGRLVVVTGARREWIDTVWSEFDPSVVDGYARAFGGEVFDIWAAAERLTRSPRTRLHLDVAGARFTVDSDDGSDRITSEVVRASWSRTSRTPPLDRPPTDDAAYDRHERLDRSLVAVWNALLGALAPHAFVTSHVDYDQWAPAVVRTLELGAPVVHVQSTGGLKAYAVWPEDVAQHQHEYDGTPQGRALATHAGNGPTFRSVLSPRLGAVVDKIAADADTSLHDRADRVVTRSKSHLGRPSWWRSGTNATLDLRTPVHRRQMRSMTASGLRLDADRPTVTVFSHALSDAVNSNVEAFADLSTWFERTVEHAAGRRDVNWLFLDHPSQDLYDVSGFFERLVDEYGHHPHIVMRPSNTLTKNAIWSMTDMGVTVRGSVSNELPAFGIGALQSGWSEWSHAGMSHLADDEDTYWTVLGDLIDDLHAGRGTATVEQHRRARLWQWLYRCGADVATSYVPHWAALEDNEMIATLTATLLHTEPDGDPLFESIGRLWRDRTPLLLRSNLPALGSVQ